MKDAEHTRDARDVGDTRDPNMHCCVTLFGLASPLQHFDSNCDTWSGKVATVRKIARWRCGGEQSRGVQGLFRDDACVDFMSRSPNHCQDTFPSLRHLDRSLTAGRFLS